MHRRSDDITSFSAVMQCPVVLRGSSRVPVPCVTSQKNVSKGG